METSVLAGSDFLVGPSMFTTAIVGSQFQCLGTAALVHNVSVGSGFLISTFDDGDSNSSYKRVFYLFAGRYGK